MNDKYRHEYRLVPRFGNWDHTYIVETAHGAVQLRMTDYGEDRSEHFVERFSGGVEFHWRLAPSWAKDKAPDHPQCHILHAPCWHDGTSLYASEHYAPMLESGASHEIIFLSLEHDAKRLDPYEDERRK